MNLRWLRYADKRSFFAIAAGALVSLVLGWNLFLKPDMQKIVDLMKNKKDRLTRSAVIGQIAGLEKKFAVYEGRWATSSDPIGFMNVVNKLADGAHFPLKSLDPQISPRDTEAYDKITISLQAQCDYHQLGEFLSRLESCPNVIHILSLQMHPAGGENGGMTVLDASMQLATYAPVGKSSS